MALPKRQNQLMSWLCKCKRNYIYISYSNNARRRCDKNTETQWVQHISAQLNQKWMHLVTTCNNPTGGPLLFTCCAAIVLCSKYFRSYIYIYIHATLHLCKWYISYIYIHLHVIVSVCIPACRSVCVFLVAMAMSTKNWPSWFNI